MSTPVMHSKAANPYGEIEQVRAGLDWLSLTLDISAKDGQDWAAECIAIIGEIAEEGHAVGTFGLNGYKGVMSGGSFYGKRDDGWYMQLSGANAQAHYRRIMRPDVQCARLDLAVTVQFRVMPKGLGDTLYQEAAKSAQTLSSGRARKIWIMSGTDGGFTLYIGSPRSDQRGRVYNKEVQSDTPEFARCWRYEVVLRNALADQQYASICAVHEIYAPLIVSSVVSEWYNVRGVATPWQTEHYNAVLPVIKKNPSDATRKLLWLEKQVKPAVKWLKEHGYEAEVFAALDIPIGL